MNFMFIRSIDRAEIQQPILLFLFAMWFLLFDATQSTTSYLMFRGLTDFEWSLIFAAAGVIKAFAIITENIKLNLAAVLIVIILWSVVLYLFAVSNYHSHAVPIMFFFVYINVLRLTEIIKSLKN